jgi:hypothetical protein
LHTWTKLLDLGEAVSVSTQKVVRLKDLPAFKMTISKKLLSDDGKAQITSVNFKEIFPKDPYKTFSKIQYNHIKAEDIEKIANSKASTDDLKLKPSYSKSISFLNKAEKSNPVIFNSALVRRLVHKSQSNSSPFYQKEKVLEHNISKIRSESQELLKPIQKAEREYNELMNQLKRDHQAKVSQQFLQRLIKDTKKRSNLDMKNYNFNEFFHSTESIQSYENLCKDKPKMYRKFTKHYELGSPKFKRNQHFQSSSLPPQKKKAVPEESSNTITLNLTHESLKFPVEERDRLEAIKRLAIDAQEQKPTVIETLKNDTQETLDSYRFTQNPYRKSIEDITKVPAKALQEPIGKIDHPILGRSEVGLFVSRWNKQSLANFTPEKRRSVSAVRAKSSTKRFVSPFIRYKENLDRDTVNFTIYSTMATERLTRDEKFFTSDPLRVTKVDLDSRGGTHRSNDKMNTIH